MDFFCSNWNAHSVLGPRFASILYHNGGLVGWRRDLSNPDPDSLTAGQDPAPHVVLCCCFSRASSQPAARLN